KLRFCQVTIGLVLLPHWVACVLFWDGSLYLLGYPENNYTKLFLEDYNNLTSQQFNPFSIFATNGNYRKKD
ncbi:MAG: hypothetical protein ABI359_13840, partial [Ginsengibacter sp.]